MRISDWSSDVCSSDLTAAGPCDGQLFANGSGIDGTVQLSAAGSYQRADIHARANNAVLPAPAKLVIGRAIIDGHAILYDEPEVVDDVQFGQPQLGTLELNAARAQIHYQGGRGDKWEERRVGQGGRGTRKLSR